MFKIIVCIKQVPMVSELPWNSRTGTLRRELAQGMMDPASRRALEAALRIKEHMAEQDRQASITVVTMGPPMAEEILHEAKALGADQGVLLTDQKMAGADTFLTSHILCRCITTLCPGFHLILTGSHSSDSETAQVGPQLALELGIPSLGYVMSLDIDPSMEKEWRVRVDRHVDDFMETLEMELPGLMTIDQAAFEPRYLALEGVEKAFQHPDIRIMNAEQLGLDPAFNALKDSPTRIIEVYSPTEEKENRVLKGAAKKIVDQLFEDYGEIISSAMGKDLKTHEHAGDQ